MNTNNSEYTITNTKDCGFLAEVANEKLAKILASGKPALVVSAFLQSWMRRNVQYNSAVLVFSAKTTRLLGNYTRVTKWGITQHYLVSGKVYTRENIPVVLYPDELIEYGSVLLEKGVIGDGWEVVDIKDEEGEVFYLHMPKDGGFDLELYGEVVVY